MDGKIVPLEIDKEEGLSRIILHSFHYSRSKNKLRPEAFLPRPNERNEISILREEYTTLDFCKSHGLKMAKVKSKPNNTCTFIGVAILYSYELDQISDDERVKERHFKVSSNASPLDQNDKLRDLSEDVFIDDDGIPSHGSIIYDGLDAESHKPICPEFKRLVIKEMVSLAQPRLKKDMNLDVEGWMGE